MRLIHGITIWAWGAEFLTASEFLLALPIPLFLLDIALEKSGDEYLGQSSFVTWRLAAASSLTLVTAFMSANQANAFIYFQF
jgi:hypothetical protein